MTILTNKLNEQLFTELTPEKAEVIQGGHKFEGYDFLNLKGSRLAAANSALPKLKYDNDISSINIESGVWKVYDLPDYKGQSYTFGPGTYNLNNYSWPKGGTINNQISSLKKI